MEEHQKIHTCIEPNGTWLDAPLAYEMGYLCQSKGQP